MTYTMMHRLRSYILLKDILQKRMLHST